MQHMLLKIQITPHNPQSNKENQWNTVVCMPLPQTPENGILNAKAFFFFFFPHPQ
jgi:hypothetical protein